jgi:hypothetical protein
MDARLLVLCTALCVMVDLHYPTHTHHSARCVVDLAQPDRLSWSSTQPTHFDTLPFQYHGPENPKTIMCSASLR